MGSRGRGVAGGDESSSERRTEEREESPPLESVTAAAKTLHPSSSLFLLLLLLHGLPPPPPPSSSLCQCITNTDRDSGYNSSLLLPDATLNFAKKHPLMADKALARPLLLTKGVNFTRLAVDRVNALDQRVYNMLFVGTGTCTHTRTPVPGARRWLISLLAPSKLHPSVSGCRDFPKPFHHERIAAPPVASN